MAGERYTQEFKVAAVKQITQEGHSIPDVARRLSITNTSLYDYGQGMVIMHQLTKPHSLKRCAKTLDTQGV